MKNVIIEFVATTLFHLSTVGFVLGLLFSSKKFRLLIEELYFSLLKLADTNQPLKGQALKSIEDVFNYLYKTKSRISKRKVLAITLCLNINFFVGLYTLNLGPPDFIVWDGDYANAALIFFIALLSSFTIEYISARATLFFINRAKLANSAKYFIYDAVFLCLWVVTPLCLAAFLWDSEIGRAFSALVLFSISPIIQLTVLIHAFIWDGLSALIILPSVLSFCLPTLVCYLVFRIFVSQEAFRKMMEVIEIFDNLGPTKIFGFSIASISFGSALLSYTAGLT